jgi:hypothetical protein
MAVEPNLPSRYEIRVLTLEHSEWVRAIISHNTAFSSPVWINIYTEDLTKRCYDMFQIGAHMADQQLETGLCLGVFDKEYEFKRAESVPTGGKLYWDFVDESADEHKLAEQMDFPLVSVAQAFDSFYPLDMSRSMKLIEMMPQVTVRNRIFDERDKRNPASWKATGPGQVLFRSGTGTKPGEEGKGFMKALAWRIMRRAAEQGYRGIHIQAGHDAVIHVWSRPPSPFKAEVVAKCNGVGDEDDEYRQAFQGSVQDQVRIYITLKT